MVKLDFFWCDNMVIVWTSWSTYVDRLHHSIEPSHAPPRSEISHIPAPFVGVAFEREGSYQRHTPGALKQCHVTPPPGGALYWRPPPTWIWVS